MTTTIPLPEGAVDCEDFGELASRVVYGEKYSDDAAEAYVVPTCIQGRTGAIFDDPLQEGPRVIVGAGLDSVAMTPMAARDFAVQMLAAARQAADWRIRAAMDKHPAGRAL